MHKYSTLHHTEFCVPYNSIRSPCLPVVSICLGRSILYWIKTYWHTFVITNENRACAICIQTVSTLKTKMFVLNLIVMVNLCKGNIWHFTVTQNVTGVQRDGNGKTGHLLTTPMLVYNCILQKIIGSINRKII